MVAINQSKLSWAQVAAATENVTIIDDQRHVLRSHIRH